MAAPMNDDELAAFLRLLHRYAEVELDQWEAWRCGTAYGEVFVTIGREPPAGYDRELFQPLPDPPS